MARTKNRGYQQTLSPAYAVSRRWKMGIYIRLSKEDLKKIREGRDDSNSVVNQRNMLLEYYQDHIEEFESIEVYVDDGYTGTDQERDDFQRLLNDIRLGRINCVAVKDLSRFARNYAEAGILIEQHFVSMGVRFISLMDKRLDSYRDPEGIYDISVPLTNMMNDKYCFQTSQKIRQVFDYKRRNGQYIGSFAPYGYIKDEADKHHLVVDPDAAEVVRLIFSMCLQGNTRRAMVHYLNDHGIPSPTAYRRLKGLPVSSKWDDPMWGDRVVQNILANPIYTGDLVQGRRRVKSYKVHQIEAVPEEEWVRVPDTHEAIIDKETFEKVQSLLKRDTRSAPRTTELHLFSGFLRCADCGKSVTRSQSGKNVYYACSTYKNRSRLACSMHSIKHERLEAAVLYAIRQQVHLAVSYSEVIAKINSAPIKKASLSDWTIRSIQRNESLPK